MRSYAIRYGSRSAGELGCEATIRAIIPEVIAALRRRAWHRALASVRLFGNDVPRVALVAAPAIVDRLRIVAVADVSPAADRTCVHFHHVPLVAAARPPDLWDRAKYLLDSANAG